MGTKCLKVQMRVSVQLQMALNDTRQWIRVLSSKTFTFYKHKCSPCSVLWWVSVTLLFKLVHQNEQIFVRVMTQRVLDKTLIHRLVSFKALWKDLFILMRKVVQCFHWPTYFVNMIFIFFILMAATHPKKVGTETCLPLFTFPFTCTF